MLGIRRCSSFIYSAIVNESLNDETTRTLLPANALTYVDLGLLLPSDLPAWRPMDGLVPPPRQNVLKFSRFTGGGFIVAPTTHMANICCDR